MNEIGQPAWRVVWATSMRQLSGWKGALILFAFSMLMSVNTVLLISNPELNVLTQQQIIDRTLHTVVLINALIALLVGANAFSSERDHQSLESLLLTPAPRGQIAAGKLLTALSLWLGTSVVAIPYVVMVSAGTDLVSMSVTLLFVFGAFATLFSCVVGLLVSAVSPTNAMSMALGLLIILMLVAPAELPLGVRETKLVSWITSLDPVTAMIDFQRAVILDGDQWTAHLDLFVSPILTLILCVGAIRYIDKSLTLQGGIWQ